MNDTTGLLHSTWHLNGKFGAAFFISSAQTPTEFNDIDRDEYTRIRDQYQPFESYWDGDYGSLVIIYDVDAQLAAHAELAERADLQATQDDASWRGQ